MKKFLIGLIIVVGVLVLVVGTAGTIFYIKVLRPISSPLIAVTAARTLEERRLQNHAEFRPPGSGEVTAEQIRNFVAVEEAVQAQLGTGIALLTQKQTDLLRANEAEALSAKAVLLAFGDIRDLLLKAKMAQIDAMNLASFSKDEFEWVREQLYSGATLSWFQLDVSGIAAGVPDASVQVHKFEPERRVPEQNKRLALPLVSRLQGWFALGFFGL